MYIYKLVCWTPLCTYSQLQAYPGKFIKTKVSKAAYSEYQIAFAMYKCVCVCVQLYSCAHPCTHWWGHHPPDCGAVERWSNVVNSVVNEIRNSEKQKRKHEKCLLQSMTESSSRIFLWQHIAEILLNLCFANGTSYLFIYFIVYAYNCMYLLKFI